MPLGTQFGVTRENACWLNHENRKVAANSVVEEEHASERCRGVRCVVDTEAEDLIRRCLSIDQCDRPTLSDVVDHPWMQRSRTVTIADEDDGESSTASSSSQSS